ncbi:MAG: peroxidase-related enzyme [Thermoanaerobaculia bacterium]|nr:peroxidase-related enzyme [Thermoanaerobaculia bacterium]
MTWIDTIEPDDASGRLRKLYDRIRGEDGSVDNILQAHSLRPHAMEGHLALYKNVLHHASNRVPKWFLEALGVFVSALNRCQYCVEHHARGMARLLDEPDRVSTIRAALESGEEMQKGASFDDRERAALAYARRLTISPGEIDEEDVRILRDAGWSDGEILEINQVVSYFAYANRTVLGLGVTTEGDVLGLSPSGEGWRHR